MGSQMDSRRIANGGKTDIYQSNQYDDINTETCKIFANAVYIIRVLFVLSTNKYYLLKIISFQRSQNECNGQQKDAKDKSSNLFFCYPFTISLLSLCYPIPIPIGVQRGGGGPCLPLLGHFVHDFRKRLHFYLYSLPPPLSFSLRHILGFGLCFCV